MAWWFSWSAPQPGDGSASCSMNSLEEALLSDGAPAADGRKPVPGVPSHQTLLGHLRLPLTFSSELIAWYRGVRPYTRRELAADGLVHALGLLLGAVALGALVSRFVEEPPRWVALCMGVYMFGLLSMLVCSAAFNVGQRVRGWDSEFLALLDHVGICLLIAGSHVPVLTRACCLRSLIVVWVLMLLTMAAKATRGWFDHIALHVAAFVFGPICAVIATHERVAAALEPWELQCVFAAGAIYIGGLIPWSLRPLEFHVAIWHVCVLAASACIYITVFLSVATPDKVKELEHDLTVCALKGPHALD